MRTLMWPKVLLLILSVGSFSAAVAAWQGQKPIKRDPNFHVDYRNSAKDLGELWTKSRLVIQGTIQSLHADDRPTSSGAVRIGTTYSVRVSEVFRYADRNGQPPAVIPLRRSGGVRDKGDHILELMDERYPPFVPGETYFFFLVVPAAGDVYVETTGPDSVFRVANGAINALGTSPLAKSFHHMPVVEFRRLLEELRGSR